MEQTFVFLKPDTLHRGYVGEIITRFEKKWFQIVALKMFQLEENILKEHYAHLADKPFFSEIVSYVTAGPVIGLILEWDKVIDQVREICGTTNPSEAKAGTIRGDYAHSIDNNIIHASDSLENAKEEIQRFFPEGKFSYTRTRGI